jgi:hypothetical protein
MQEASAGLTGRGKQIKNEHFFSSRLCLAPPHPKDRFRMIRVVCPKCEKKLGIDDRFAGQWAKCPRCRTRVQVPKSEIPLKEEPEEAKTPVEVPDIGDGESVGESSGESQPRLNEKHAGSDSESKIADDEKPADQPAGEEAGDGEKKDGEDIEVPEDWKPPVRTETGPVEAFLALNLLWQILLGLGVFCLILSMLAVSLTQSHTKPRETLAYVVLVVGGPILAVGSFWFWGRVFNESILQGIFCLFPPYAVYYFLTHTDEVQRPFYVAAAGAVMTMMYALLFYF